MPSIPSPYSALLRRGDPGAIAGEEPWLFRSEGWDWRWSSWGELARQAAAWAGALAELPPASRAAFLYIPRPEAVALDLAIQGAGLVSVPVSGDREAVAEWGCRWIEPSQWEEEQGRKGRARTDKVDQGGAVVVVGGAPVEVGAAELVEVAARVQAEITPARRTGKREIVVLGGPLEQPEERAMLTWATVAGAAVALEPAPGARVATAAWVRPTVFHGTVEEIALLRAWVEKAKKKRGLPFGRLRTVLAASPGLPEEDAAFWRERGVKVGRIPDCRRAA
ncbi:MAG TPA: hypothetical protein VFC23_21090 [Thermoanaerobaculia bacterium]|nr:hypothetical protein [Thermoanaerobaculia bacterium]